MSPDCKKGALNMEQGKTETEVMLCNVIGLNNAYKCNDGCISFSACTYNYGLPVARVLSINN